MVTLDEVREVTRDLPRSYEVLVRGRVKFRVGRIVYLDFSRDQSIMGFAFPREWRPVLVDSAPDKFMLPIPSELRWNWARVRMAAIERDEMRELVVDAWAMVVPKRVGCPGRLRPFTEGDVDNPPRGGHSDARDAIRARRPLRHRCLSPLITSPAAQ